MIKTNPDAIPEPIFIHSLFRAGSTYLFNVFRRSSYGYCCYQEPENEILICLNKNPQELLEVADDTVQLLRHPKLDKPYFWEFYALKDDLRGLFNKSFSYDEYFCPDTLGIAQKHYLETLILRANGRPVLQLCRSSGRVGALRAEFSGTHIHLWRNPWDQWWSYKLNDYFDSTTQLIFRAKTLPLVLAEVKKICQIADFHADNIFAEFAFAKAHVLPPRQNYFAFYSLWLFAFIESEKFSDVTINIDRLSADKNYREAGEESLHALGLRNIDFSDCALPRNAFQKDEIQFFEEIENAVKELFIAHGFSNEVIEHVRKEQYFSAKSGCETSDKSERFRAAALNYLSELAAAQQTNSLQDRQLRMSLENSLQRQQEAVIADEQIKTLSQNFAAERRRSEWLQHSWDDAKKNSLQLEQTLQKVAATATAHEKTLASKHEYIQALLGERDVTHKRIEELDASVRYWNDATNTVSRKAMELELLLTTKEKAILQLQNSMQQTTRQMKAFQERTKALTSELGTSKDLLQREYAHSQWLRNEWDAAKHVQAQLIESHQKELAQLNSIIQQNISDIVSKQVHIDAMLQSLSWRITLPVRKIKLAFLRAFRKIKPGLENVVQLSNSVEAESFNPISEPVMTLPDCPKEDESPYLAKLSPHSRQVYTELKFAAFKYRGEAV